MAVPLRTLELALQRLVLSEPDAAGASQLVLNTAEVPEALRGLLVSSDLERARKLLAILLRWHHHLVSATGRVHVHFVALLLTELGFKVDAAEWSNMVARIELAGCRLVVGPGATAEICLVALPSSSASTSSPAEANVWP